jgi:type 1 fimbriae regulatory protein FimB
VLRGTLWPSDATQGYQGSVHTGNCERKVEGIFCRRVHLEFLERQIPHFSYSVAYMEASKESSRTRATGRRNRGALRTRASEQGRRSERVIHFLTQDELRQLFNVIRSKRDKAIFLVAYRHGLRASEIGLLQRADVDVKQGRISIHRLKGSISAVYPMQSDVLKAIRSYLRTRTDESPYLFLSNRNVPISRDMLHHLMQTYGAVAGLPREKRKFHCLKHSIATHLLDAGADLAFVKDWLGHANIQNTTIYARLTTATFDSTARKVFASHRVV